jgi:hypothetical protein
MGLGKTIQAIAAAELFARHFGVRKFWSFAPPRSSTSGKTSSRASPSASGAGDPRPAGAAAAAVLRDDVFCKITHYETLARDADLIDAWAPELVIADEAQRIKNWNTIAARALKRIASPYADGADRHAAGEPA